MVLYLQNIVKDQLRYLIKSRFQILNQLGVVCLNFKQKRSQEVKIFKKEIKKYIVEKFLEMKS